MSPQKPRSSEPAEKVRIPDHTLFRIIGRGAYGEVWLAQNVMGTWRAVKIVRRESFTNERPYEREFDGIRKFEPVSRAHDTQVDILHVGRDDAAGLFYYVMELGDDVLRGQEIAPETYVPRTLASELSEKKRLPAKQCIEIGLALATALNHLHAHGLIHRDIKPSNIIFVHGRAKLADIGLVAVAAEALSFVGTEGYVPMEGPGSSKADIFSLGRVLYEISTGFSQRQFPDIPSSFGVGEEDAEMARELNLIINKACARGADHRHESAAVLRDELVLLQSGQSIRRLRDNERRLRVLRWVGAGAVVVAAFSLVGYVSARRANIRADANAKAALENLAAARFAQAAAEARVDFMTRELPPLLAPMGRLDLLDSVFENVGDYFSRHSDSTPEQLARRADFLTQWSQSLTPRGDVKGALVRLEEALRLATSAAPGKARATLPAARARVLAGWRMAETLIKDQQFEAAGKIIADTLEFAAQQETPDLPFRALVAQLTLLPVYEEMRKGKAAAALVPVKESLRLWSELVPLLEADLASPRSQESLVTAARAHTMLAEVCDALKDSAAKEAACTEALKATAHLTSLAPENLLFLYRRATTLLLVAGRTNRSPAEKQKLVEEAERHLSLLTARDAGNIEWRVTWVEGALRQFQWAKENNDAEGRKRWALAAAERISPLYRTHCTDVIILSARARHALVCGNYAHETKDWDAVRQHWGGAMRALRQIERMNPSPQNGDAFTSRMDKCESLLSEGTSQESAAAWRAEIENDR